MHMAASAWKSHQAVAVSCLPRAVPASCKGKTAPLTGCQLYMGGAATCQALRHHAMQGKLNVATCGAARHAQLHAAAQHAAAGCAQRGVDTAVVGIQAALMPAPNRQPFWSSMGRRVGGGKTDACNFCV
jgi:hypothetical protein